MATQYSNKPIVTDGLVYALDFGNPKSYVSGSTTANSLIYRPVPARFQSPLSGDIAQPEVAFSIRKVVTSYTGSAMMVQSASVSQSIGFDINGYLDVNALQSFAGSGDAFVKIWYDQSGNNNHATQSVATNQPKIVSSGSVLLENGKPAVQFDGINDNLIHGVSNLTSGNFTYVDVYKSIGEIYSLHSSTTTQGKWIFLSQTSTSTAISDGFTTVGSNYYKNGSIAFAITTPTRTDFKNVFYDGNQNLAFYHGTLNNIPTTAMHLGCYNGETSHYSGSLQESILYRSNQLTNRTKIETNTNNYFQIYSPVTNPVPSFSSTFTQFTTESTLRTNQSFPGFSYDQGNSTIMYVGETKGNSTTFTQDGTLSIVSTTSSVGFGSPSNNFGRSYPVTGLKHVTIRFSSGSVDCFINGLPVSASAVFPTGSSIGGGQLNIPLYTGSLGSFQVYNRPLTSDEIWNNYQLAAPRYELGPLQNKPYTLDENAYLFLQTAGITDPIITSSIDTFVRGLKSNNLWDKMIAIYPFVGTGSDGTNLTGSHRWNLKEPSLVTYPLSFTGSWIGSTSGSAPSGSNTNISVNGITPSQYYPFFNTQSAHISILSYDTPVSSSYLMGTGMTEDLAISTLAGDYGTPAAAYSVRKVRTAYSGALMDVRRSFDNVTSSIGFVSNGDLDTGSLLDWVVPGRNDLPGEYEGLAAAYSLRRVSSSYTGDAIEVRRDWDNESGSFGFDANGDLDTVSLLTFVTGSAGTGSGFVQTWYDQSGNGKHATQTVTGSQPLIVSSGSLITENGKPAVQFDGIDDQFSLNTVVNNPNYLAIIGVFKSENGVIFSYRDGVTELIQLTGEAMIENRLQIRSSNTSIQQLVVTTTLKQKLGFAQFNNVTPLHSLYIDSINNISSSTSFIGNLNSNTNYIGGTYAGGSIFSGSVQELFLYSTDQSTNRPLIENNINNYYNIYTGSNHGFVARWYDQSGNNNHATQAVTSSQPLIVESGSLIFENSRPAVQFDGVGAYLNLDIAQGRELTNSTHKAIMLVQKDNGITGARNRTLFIGLGSSTRISFQSDPGIFLGSMNLISNRVDISFNIAQQFLSYGEDLNGTQTFYLNSTVSGSNNLGGTTNDADSAFLGTNTLDYLNGKIQECVMYTSNQSTNREFIEYGINNYYNIYTQPTSSNWTTSSFTIKADSTSISGSLNNKLTSGIQSSGPLGLVTVSRTGSNSLTISRNGSATSFSVPASGALSTGIYLGAINNNGLALGNSPLNISFASVGTGLTGGEMQNLSVLTHTLRYSLRGLDPNAVLFLAAAGIVNETQIQAVNTLVLDLKEAKIWDKMKAIYPMVGKPGVSSSFEFNLKDPNTFRGTFYGTWSFADTGATPDGLTAYMDTGLSPNSNLTLNNTSMGIYNQIPTVAPKPDVPIGLRLSTANSPAFWIRFYANGPQSTSYGEDNTSIAGVGYNPSNDWNQVKGMWFNSRVSSTSHKLYRNGIVLRTDTDTNSQTFALLTHNITVGANNRENNTRVEYDSTEKSFAFIGDGLTDTEASNFYTTVQRFQTTLGRQV